MDFVRPQKAQEARRQVPQKAQEVCAVYRYERKREREGEGIHTSSASKGSEVCSERKRERRYSHDNLSMYGSASWYAIEGVVAPQVRPDTFVRMCSVEIRLHVAFIWLAHHEV